MSALAIVAKMQSIFVMLSSRIVVQEEILKGLIYRAICSEFGLANAGVKENRRTLLPWLMSDLNLFLRLMRLGEAVVCISDDSNFEIGASYLAFVKKEFDIEIDDSLEIINIKSESKLFTLLGTPVSFFIFAFSVFRHFALRPSSLFVPYMIKFLFRESLLTGTRIVLGVVVRRKIRYIFTRPYFSFQAMSWVAFLKRKGTPVFEIGHGLMNDKHPFYLDFGNFRVEGGRLLPDYFIVRNQREQVFIESQFGVKAAVYQKEKKIPTERFCNIRSSLKLGGDESLGLFSLQNIYLEDGYLDILANVLKANIASFWILSEHPMHLTQRDAIRRDLSEKGLSNIIFASEIGITTTEALEVSDVHASHSSSVLYEAAENLKKNYVCSSYGVELVADLLEDGSAINFDEQKSGL